MKIFPTLICIAFGWLMPQYSAAQSLDTILSRLISTGQYPQAQALLEANNPSADDKAFFAGRVLKSQRQYDKAIAVFRAILIRDPGYLNARRELAHTLMLDKQFEVAEYHFEQLLEIDRNPKMQAAYRRFLAVIAQNKPYGVSGMLAFAPSSNVNRGTTYSTFTDEYGNAVISEDSKAKSGIGLQFGVNGYFRKILSPRSRLTFNWSAQGVKYRDSAFDTATLRLSATYQKITEWGSWTVTPFARNTWTEEDLDPGFGEDLRYTTSSRSLGIGYGFQRKLSDRDTLSFYVSGEYRDYPLTTTQDGAFYYTTLGLDRRLRPDLSVGAGVQLERSDAAAGQLAYKGVKLTGSATKVWKNGLRTGFGVNFGKRDFDDNYFLRAYPRKDDFWGVSVSLFNPKFAWRGMAPELTCSYTRNRSNVEFFVYDVAECQISLIRNF